MPLTPADLARRLEEQGAPYGEPTERPYLEHRDPSDETDFDVLSRPSTAPHTDQIALIQEDIESLTKSGANLLRSIDYTDERVDELYARTDRMVQGLSNLAVALADLRATVTAPKLSLVQRLKVKLGRPIF